MVESINYRMNKFNPAYFEISEIWDHMSDKFDLFVITGCEHYTTVENAGVNGEANAYVEVMRSIQSSSTIIFFILINIPLSRMDLSFSFVTALVPMMLTLRTKYWFYEKANNVVCMVFRNDHEAKNHIVLPKRLRYATKSESLDRAPADIVLTKGEAAQQ
jgi:hypothetical protein